MIPIKTNLANRNNYGKQRSMDIALWMVFHYTANDGDHDESNANYFKQDLKANGKAVASAHIFVDDDSATISVPLNFVAYSVGGSRYSDYKKTGGAKYYGKCTNANSINIEMCDTVKDGKLQATLQTMKNAIEVAAMYMEKYNIPIERAVRHFDVTGKACPSYLVDENAWKEFKKLLQAELENRKIPGEATEAKTFVTLKESFLRSDPGTGNATKVKYDDKLPDAVKKICQADKDGWAKVIKGKSYSRRRIYKSTNAVWHRMANGYWICNEYNGTAYSKEKQ